MGKVIFKVSGELLAALLNLPKGTEICHVFQWDGKSPRDLGLTVEHADLADVKDPIRVAVPSFRRITSSAVEFEDWGLQ